MQSLDIPDVLINKHLEGAAQLLVKSNKDIDDIWVRLKEVYGDIKTLLANKLSKLKQNTLHFPGNIVEPQTALIINRNNLIVHKTKKTFCTDIS